PEQLAAHVACLGTMAAVLDIVEVAFDTNLDVEIVAAIHFQLGDQLQLHWLRDRIVELARADRWGALARAALRDDLFGLHRQITQEVLENGPKEGTPEERVRGWIDSNEGAERYLQTIADVRLGRMVDLTTLPVVVREVRNLL